jgi:hypothetical protein
MKSKDLAKLLMKQPEANVLVKMGDENACPVLYGEMFTTESQEVFIVIHCDEGDWEFLPEQDLTDIKA